MQTQHRQSAIRMHRPIFHQAAYNPHSTVYYQVGSQQSTVGWCYGLQLCIFLSQKIPMRNIPLAQVQVVTVAVMANEALLQAI